MANETIIPSRMELSRIKNKLAVTRRGYHLLKDKFDSLVKTFLAAVNEYLDYSKDVSNELARILKEYRSISDNIFAIELMQQLLTNIRLKLNKKVELLYSISIPSLEVEVLGKLENSLLMPNSIIVSQQKMLEFFPKFLVLASMEKKCFLLANEIEKIRRRVNAIEYILIPQIERQVRLIRLHLAEAEISNQVRIMKSKEIILKKRGGQ
jgi:V/A-type H+-transporting ATPase subunit D